MHSLATALLALAGAALLPLASANSYELYCGSSCTNGTLISSGSNYSGADCTELDETAAYCYLVADKTAYKAIVSNSTDCLGGDYEQVIDPGECFEGEWSSYQVSVDL